ncbi:MAG: AMP-binding protein, partial [Planctomycetales bacterium]|nr:AMP-binding protein [Planctomycetales bacterium]
MNVAQLAIDGLERFGEYNSLFFEGRWYSNFQLMEDYCKLASVLRDLGIKPGDRVVVMMASCPEVPAAFHALARLGAVVVPLMPQLLAREVAYIVENSGAQFVITSADLAPRIAEATADIDGFRQILTIDESGLPACTNLAPLLASASPLTTLCTRSERDLALLVYTSGTTGHPKGVMISHGNLIDNTHAAAKRLDWPPDLRSMMVLPMSHVYGILIMNLGAVLGGVNALLRKFSVEQAFQTIQDFKVERCSLVPTMMVGMIHHPEREKYDVSSLERITGGSAPLTEEVRRRFEELFHCRVYDGYGQSEATCAVCAYENDEPFVQGSAGRPLAGFDVCVQDDDNQIVPVGQTGELCFRGPSVMLGYWNNEEATRRTIIDGWLHSGDIGHIDQRGYMYITDRKKDMMIKGGENISPREIEEIICQLAGVAEVAVLGVPDETYQEEIAAYIVPQAIDLLTREQVLEFLAPQINKFKLPKYINFVPQLPKN